MLKVKRLMNPTVLHERVADVQHPTLGNVQVCLVFGSRSVMFRFAGGECHVVELNALADEVFEQIETAGGKP